MNLDPAQLAAAATTQAKRVAITRAQKRLYFASGPESEESGASMFMDWVEQEGSEMNRSILAWHFSGDKLRNGEPIPKQGEWLKIPEQPIMCQRGLHASRHPYDALKYAPGAALHRVRLAGTILVGDDKLVATRRKIIWTVPPEIIQPLMWDFARYCAISVLHLWDAPDVVKEYLKTGDESLQVAARAAANSAAKDAAKDAARAAAYSAANYAAWDAAYSAAESDQRKYLIAAIKEAHKKALK